MKSIAIGIVMAGLSGAAQADERDARMYESWARNHGTGELQAFLANKGLGDIVPIYQLLRTASDWRKCQAAPFEVPPEAQWPHVASVLALVAELKKRRVLVDFEAVSSYRNPALNGCAGGSGNSAHTKNFAIDIVMRGNEPDEKLLCQFWQREGRAWKMGLSRYPSGRIHLDTSSYRTWGADYTQRTSFCRLPA